MINEVTRRMGARDPFEWIYKRSRSVHWQGQRCDEGRSRGSSARGRCWRPRSGAQLRPCYSLAYPSWSGM